LNIFLEICIKKYQAVPAEVVEEAALDSLFESDNAIPASPPDDRAAWVAAWTEVKAS
jgi:spermidine/putrescine transport system substrate-binding protein